MTWEIRHGDCLELMRAMPDNSVDAVVTDPPYGLSFMGKKWDYDVPGTEVWAECLRVLKPGGHLLAFAGTRTQHRMAVRIEDAGFEIRDMIAWVYGSGFPKSLDVSKAIDKAAGVARGANPDVRNGPNTNPATKGKPSIVGGYAIEKAIDCGPCTEAAHKWQGWGTALKPAMEPITVARKPLVGTVAANVLEHGTGALNIDGCRVEADWANDPSMRGVGYGFTNDGFLGDGGAVKFHEQSREWRPTQGRWPANLIHDGSEEAVGLLSQTTSGTGAVRKNARGQFGLGGDGGSNVEYGDTGSAARFFYCAKASKADRNSGGVNSNHPTVKPTALMRYLCRLVTPPGGTVLDPFTGSGSTGKAAILEGFNFIGCEREAEYVEIARARIAHVEANPEPKPQQLSIFDTP